MKSEEGICGEEEEAGRSAEGVVHYSAIGQRTITTGANCVEGAFRARLLSHGGARG